MSDEIVSLTVAFPDPVIQSIVIEEGLAGAPGSVWRNGSGVPSDSLGADGDYYLDDDAGNVYAKAAGAYTLVAEITGPPGSQGTPVIPIGNSVFVDAVEGDDDTGAAYRQDLPFLTLTAAKNAASAGDTIFVGPGAYAANDLAKDGVNWHFCNGASIVYDGASNRGIFDDYAGACVCRISGRGDFSWDSTTALTGSNYSGVIVCTNASSKFSISAGVVTCATSGSNKTAVTLKGGAINLDCLEVASAQVALYWENGDLFASCDHVNSPDAIALSAVGKTATYTGKCWVQAKKIEGSIVTSVVTSADTTGKAMRIWVMAEEIIGAHDIEGGSVYIAAEKMDYADDIVLYQNAGELWLSAQKITSGTQWLYFEDAFGVFSGAYIDVLQFEDGGAMSGPGIENEGGENVVIRSTQISSNQNGVLHNGGTTRILGAAIGATGASTNPVVVGAAGLTLESVSLVAAGARASIYATGAQTVTCRGAAANNAADSHITVAGWLAIGSATPLIASANLSDVASAATALANLGGAPLASPGLTGNPTAPTQTLGDSSTKISTTAFVAAAIAALINSAPGALDTLKELADALGDDPNYAATITGLLAGKLAKASNLSDLANVATALTNLGATTIGKALFALANPSAVTFPRLNADNSVSALTAAAFKTALAIATGDVSGVRAIAGGGTGVSSLPVCILGSATDLSVANATDTKLTIWSKTATGSYDPDSMYASGVVTVPIAGVYDIDAACATDYDPNTTIMKLYVNGAAYQNRYGKISGQNFVFIHQTLKLAAGDQVAIYGWHNAGGAIYYYGSDNSASFTVRFRATD
ncbi:MAG TPA: hypothetical protein VHW03_04535 [Chthoniobacterales bacterium]|nr:hypothetical protein [Chthoniobacterales bacterium]